MTAPAADAADGARCARTAAVGQTQLVCAEQRGEELLVWASSNHATTWALQSRVDVGDSERLMDLRVRRDGVGHDVYLVTSSTLLRSADLRNWTSIREADHYLPGMVTAAMVEPERTASDAESLVFTPNATVGLIIVDGPLGQRDVPTTRTDIRSLLPGGGLSGEHAIVHLSRTASRDGVLLGPLTVSSCDAFLACKSVVGELGERYLASVTRLGEGDYLLVTVPRQPGPVESRVMVHRVRSGVVTAWQSLQELVQGAAAGRYSVLVNVAGNPRRPGMLVARVASVPSKGPSSETVWLSTDNGARWHKHAGAGTRYRLPWTKSLGLSSAGDLGLIWLPSGRLLATANRGESIKEALLYRSDDLGRTWKVSS